MMAKIQVNRRISKTHGRNLSKSTTETNWKTGGKRNFKGSSRISKTQISDTPKQNQNQKQKQNGN